MFIRITATKWKLTDEMRHQIGALLVYIRNEFRAGESAYYATVPSIKQSRVEGAAIRYKKMQQCIDLLLSRLDGTWDAHKLTLAYSMIARALEKCGDQHLSRAIVNEAENAYGTTLADSCWHRIPSEGYTLISDEAREIAARSLNAGGSDCESIAGNEHTDSDRARSDPPDSDGTGTGDRL